MKFPTPALIISDVLKNNCSPVQNSFIPSEFTHSPAFIKQSLCQFSGMWILFYLKEILAMLFYFKE
jgi:hypothetical protein